MRTETNGKTKEPLEDLGLQQRLVQLGAKEVYIRN